MGEKFIIKSINYAQKIIKYYYIWFRSWLDLDQDQPRLDPNLGQDGLGLESKSNPTQHQNSI